jgi:hypothetical protein
MHCVWSRCGATFDAPLLELLRTRPLLCELDARETEMPLTALLQLPHTLRLVNVSECFMPANELRTRDEALAHKAAIEFAVEALKRQEGPHRTGQRGAATRVRAHIDYNHKLHGESLQAELLENPYLGCYCADWKAALKEPGRRATLEQRT